MNRRDIFRVIGAAGAAAALPAPAREFPKDYDPEKELLLREHEVKNR
jgi:hypothetical protein